MVRIFSYTGIRPKREFCAGGNRLHLNSEMEAIGVTVNEFPGNTGQNYFPLAKANSQHSFLSLLYISYSSFSRKSPRTLDNTKGRGSNGPDFWPLQRGVNILYARYFSKNVFSKSIFCYRYAYLAQLSRSFPLASDGGRVLSLTCLMASQKSLHRHCADFSALRPLPADSYSRIGVYPLRIFCVTVINLDFLCDFACRQGGLKNDPSSDRTGRLQQ
jgi:hypothetical protein